MIDLKALRENPEAVRASQRARGEDETVVDALLSADERRRAAIARADALRGEQKSFGKQVGRAKGEERDALLAKGKELAAEVKAAEAEQSAAGGTSEATGESDEDVVDAEIVDEGQNDGSGEGDQK